jgi:hypothetical protein
MSKEIGILGEKPLARVKCRGFSNLERWLAESKLRKICV